METQGGQGKMKLFEGIVCSAQRSHKKHDLLDIHNTCARHWMLPNQAHLEEVPLADM